MLDDSSQWVKWLDLYTDDATYWVPYTKDQTDPRAAPSIILEDKPMMRMRIEKLKHPRSWSQIPASRTARIVGNVVIEKNLVDRRELVVLSTFNMLEFRNDRFNNYAGEYTHTLSYEEDRLLIRQKRVDLITEDGIYEDFIQLHF